MQLTVKESILHVKLRDSPSTNRGHRNKRMNGGPVSNGSESLLVVTTVLLLKTTSNKTLFKAFNKTIRASLDLVDPFARDWNNREGAGNKIPSVGTLRSNNLLSHSKLPLRISNSISLGGRLRKTNGRACRLLSHRGRRDERWRRTWMTSIVI
jgi:hypothetical protein